MTATALSGCVVSDDPAVNALATTAAVGTVASLLYYSVDDGYYYDNDYDRMPRGYRPSNNAHIRRISSMDVYRRQHPLDGYRVQNHEGRIQQQRFDHQVEQNRDMRDGMETRRTRFHQSWSRNDNRYNRDSQGDNRNQQRSPNMQDHIQQHNQDMRDHLNQWRNHSQDGNRSWFSNDNDR